MLLILLSSTAVWAADPAPSLLPNGNLEKTTKDAAWPDGWPHGKGVTWVEEEGNHFLRLQTEKPGEMVMLYISVPMKPEYQTLELSYRVRHKDIKPGKQAWFDGRIMMNFKDDAGQVVKPGPSHPNYRGSSKGWLDRKQQIAVPQGAKTLEIMPTLFQAESGTLEFDDFSLVPLSAAAAAAAAAAAPKKTPTPKPAPKPEAPPSQTMAPPEGASLPKELRVAGNQLQTPDGKAVWLQGLAVCSMEWTAVGEHIPQSIEVGIEQWKANIIRLPVKDDFWFGQSQYQNDGGAAYRKLTDTAVNAAASRGAYLALDLHRFGAPTDEHVKFWKDAAMRYKNHPAVLFDLFNEAHGITWEVWRNGGNLEDKTAKGADVNAAENAEKTAARKSPGMQALVDAVRSTGARNVVIAGGLDWGYDLSGVMQGFALEERSVGAGSGGGGGNVGGNGNGIMYSSHIYPWKKGWQTKVIPAAEKYPLLIGEVGCTQERMPFIPPEQHEDPSTWAPDMLGFIQKYKLNWTGWCFHPKSSPQILSDWNYTPTPFWGVYVKEALSGKQFEMKKMR